MFYPYLSLVQPPRIGLNASGVLRKLYEMTKPWFTRWLILILSILVGYLILSLPNSFSVSSHTDNPTAAEYRKQLEDSAELQYLTRKSIEVTTEQQQRFGKILATWEAQQQQYQIYLDKLAASNAVNESPTRGGAD